MKVRDLKHWLLNSEVQPEDDIDILGGNTITVFQGGKIVECFPIGSTSFKEFRKQCYAEFKAGIVPQDDFFEEKVDDKG